MRLITLLKSFSSATFNIDFSVLTNFVMFVYLDDFSNSILFQWLSAISLNFCCLLVRAFTRYFKGHLEIPASTLYHKSHYPESHYLHIISNDIGTAKISFFSYNFFFGKYKTSIPKTNQYYLFCLVMWHQYHFDTITHFYTIFYSFIQRHQLVFYTKGCLNCWNYPSISVWEKIATRKIWKLSSKTSML